MISTEKTRVKIKEVVSSQLPNFVLENYPLVSEFLKEYYTSQEYSGSPLDLLQNLDQYFDIDSLVNHTKTCILNGDLEDFSDTIPVVYDPSISLLGTYGFPEKYGILKINDEIILYKSKTERSFNECVRGFSGIDEYQDGSNPEQLIFKETNPSSHSDQSTIQNLSVLFLEKFLQKIKEQFLPGFEDRDISPQINLKTLISKISNFYDSKGTEESIRILFGILYGKKVDVVNPKDFLLKPSSSIYRKTKDLIVEALEGNPLQLKNRTLIQDAIPEYGIKRSEASVTDVEIIKTDEKDYYRIKLDYEYDIQNRNNAYVSASAPFVVHPHTKTTLTKSPTSTVLDVDSTIGFPSSGNIIVNLTDGSTEVLSYKSKSFTQFFDVSSSSTDVGIGATVKLDIFAYGYPGISTSEVVKVKIGSVFKNVKIVDDEFYFEPGDTARVTQLGIADTSFKANDWFLNIPIKYDILEFLLIDSSNSAYQIKTFDDTIFKVNDSAVLLDTNLKSIECTITSISSKNSFTITTKELLKSTETYKIERKIGKSQVNPILSNYSYINDYNSDIQNIYSNFLSEVLVSSSSIPAYNDQPLSFYDRIINLKGSYSGDTLTITDVLDHGFYTGDAVYYQTNKFLGDDGVEVESKLDNLSEGTYFVTRLNKNQLKLSRSRPDAYKNSFVDFSGNVTLNYIKPIEFKNSTIKNQNLLRVIKTPDNQSGIYETPVDSNIGIFINGVELTNYKSSDFVRYGEIQSSSVLKSGENYDVINPPILEIYDSIGVGVSASVSVIGNLQRVEIIDGGFDYVSEPTIDIRGGNGTGAKAKANTSLVTHSVSFYASEESAFIDLTNNSIGFSTFHKFRGVESVIYKTDGKTGIVGLTTNSSYFVKSIDPQTVQLFKTENDAISGINTINLTGYGSGIHSLESVEKKKIVTGVLVIDSGHGYQNKERTCVQTGINTALDLINIENHGYNSGEIIVYSASGTPVSGLSTLSEYVVTKIDSDNFKLSQVGIASTNVYFYYDTKQYVNLTSSGSGTHIFNYQPITVIISGKTGVSTSANQNFNAVLQPFFRGEIESVNIRSGGIGYGSSEILNYDRQPNYELLSGKDAELLPIVNNGSITEVIINYGGQQYNSPPDLLINGKGNYAILTPIIENGRIASVKIINGGSGYDSTTSITVIPSGKGANLSFNIKQWNVNEFSKNLNIISPDDGIIKESINEEYQLQYTHVYTPRKLRESVYQKTKDNKISYGVFDLQKINGQEILSKNHSPIIGWAYDGNPIYGPYGFINATGSSTEGSEITKLMKSGYKIVDSPNRPKFPLGFFVEDYVFDNTGDLDEHNGRYCVTPEYPSGTYAYFTTIDTNSNDGDGPFSGYRKPVFPYVIGSSFKSKPIDFNFNKLSNQKDFDISTFNGENYSGPWLRNTNSYNLQSPHSSYDYFSSTLRSKDYTATIKSTSEGQIESIKILNSGNNYKVGDKVIFDNTDSGGKAVAASISEVQGKDVNHVSVASTIIYDAEISPVNSDGRYIVFTNTPHNLSNIDLVSISGVTTFSSNLSGNFTIGVSSEKFVLMTPIGTSFSTGIVTYISVFGNLNNAKIRENDVLQINSEKLKVLNVEPLSSRIRVLREFDGTVGVSHTASSNVIEVPRKFIFTSLPENNVIFERNREIYFNPQESIALGTSFGVGIGTTITFSNVGSGITQFFVPTRSIYLPEHGFVTGEPLIYSNNTGNSIVVSNGSTTFNLNNLSTVYSAKFSDNLLGISTVKIGIGTSGTFVGVGTDQGLLSFVGFGTGVYHSFKTIKNNSIKCNITKNTVTVSTASTHNLSLYDTVTLSSKPTTSFTIKVVYNDYNRRLVINPRTFTGSDVNVDNNTIFIENHKLKTGDAVIHTSNSPSGGLEDQKIYYVISYTKDLIKLSKTRYGTEIFEKNIVDITSSSSGTISPINPRIEAYRNSQVIFDLSDSSLSSSYSSNLYSAFELRLFTDEDLTQEFFGSLSQNSFNVSRIGTVGISTNASLRLKIDDNTPTKLFYSLIPINLNFISTSKKEIVIDSDVTNNNLLEIVSSKYSGTHIISGVGTTTFNYSISEVPERVSYASTEAIITYTTNSNNVVGSISSIKINYGGYGYKQIPGISTVVSENGNGALLEPFSSGIGTILSIAPDSLGYDLPTDKTLRPLCNLPEIFKATPSNSLESINVISNGRGYSLPPNLILIDGVTNKVVDDVDLRFTLGKTKVDILKNTKGLNGQPRIIPTNNSNGVKIESISFNPTTKNVSVGINSGFSDVFPFSVGDKVLIENVSVGINSTGRGYNSKNYDYRLFTITDVPEGNAGLGGNIGIVTFSMSDFLTNEELPGTYNSQDSYGRMIAEKDFPIFDIRLKTNTFARGEVVVSNDKTGIVENWNSKVNILKITSSKEFTTGDEFKGLGTKSKGIIGEKYDFNAYVDIDATSEIVDGWSDEVGFLNNNLQRIQNNEYYQNFSYSLKSSISIDDWDNPISSLSHSAGLSKFSDLQLESNSIKNFSANTDNRGSRVDTFTDIISEVDLSCYQDYDAVSENEFNIENNIVSSEIYFSNRTLTDYYESIGNRVLTIDDVSPQFNSDPRPTRYSVVDQFDKNEFVKKYFTYVRDKRFTSHRQALIVDVVHNGTTGYLNQYGRIESSYDIGSFDVSFSEDSGFLLFYPTMYEVNDFDISYLTFDIINTISGIGSTTLGDTVLIKSQKSIVPSSTTGTVISIGTSYRSSKVIVEINSDDGRREIDELNVIHDGTNVELLEYGQMTSSGTNSFEPSGLGTYSAYISGSNLNIDFTPVTGVGVTVDSLQISIANTSSSGVSTVYFGFDSQTIAFIDSSVTSIASTSSPTENIISRYDNDESTDDQHDASYFIVSVEDKTNNRYQMSEVILLDSGNETYLTEYGNIQTLSGIGTIGSGIATGYTYLYFTPEPNIDVEVRVFQSSLQLVTPTEIVPEIELNLNNSKITSGFANYEGTFSDVRRQFELRHKGFNIFRRDFLGNSSSIVDLDSNTITIPEHFFVSGEELTYTYVGVGSTQAIGIASTDFGVGIGTTNKIPSKVYAIRVDDKRIRLARSAEEALLPNPIALNITNVGIGTSHTFTSNNQNGKCLVTIDNYIQTPIVATSITTGLSTSITLTDNVIKVTGINSFFSGDLIKINDEIMKIESVGFGSDTDILVRRPWMGTELNLHDQSSVITKIRGNYNIVGNSIHFVDAPRGPIPIGSSTNAPDERDWTGITTRSSFHGRTFLRNGAVNSTEDTYSRNYVFDDISEGFDAVTKTFTLKSNSQNITGFSTNNSIILINGIFQNPQGTLVETQDYTLNENVGITSITFLGAATSVSSDPNTASIPIGGIIVSVGSTGGFGYQPLVAAGGTAIVSTSGTISSVSIGNSGSGYRSGIQTTVNVGVYTSSVDIPNIEYIGVASILNGHIVSVAITNPGIGYTSSNPPKVIFDSPLSYSNIPLIYSSSSISGVGTEARVNIVVGQGSSVIDFEFSNFGYSYGNNQVLTIESGGLAGIPTDPSKPFSEFKINIEKILSNSFSGWNIGELEIFDNIENRFDGIRRKFTIRKNNSPVTIRSKKGSNIDVQSSLLVFLNNVLQVPGEGYTFTGGSVITFAEPPSPPVDGIEGTGDKCSILFYKGSGDIDVRFTDVLETIKIGDTLTINDNPQLCSGSIQQDERLVVDIISSDTVETNPYNGPGIKDNPNCIRPVSWCHQRTDRLVNGIVIGKSRVLYEPLINATANIIQSVGIGTTIIFVDNIKTFFDPKNENQTASNQKKLLILSKDEFVSAAATAIVSVGGTVTSISITDGGMGYDVVPDVSISLPVGLGTTQRATGIASVTLGIVTSITVSYGGTNNAYSQENPPIVLIEPPSPTYEINDAVSLSGDFGIIVGVASTSVGVASTGIIFTLYIPEDSYLRSSEIMGISGITTISGIQTGYYFVADKTNIGNTNGVRSLYEDNSILGIGTQFLDNVYRVADVSTSQINLPGIGLTYVTKVTVGVDDNTITGYGHTTYFGEYSWGKIVMGDRLSPKSFNSYTENGILGISTSASITRVIPLKYQNYT